MGERRAYGLVALGCSGYNGSGLRRGLEQAPAEDSGGMEADLTACGLEGIEGVAWDVEIAEAVQQSPSDVLQAAEELDRLTHRVHIIEANGPSYRLRESKRRLKQPRSQPEKSGRTEPKQP